MYLVNLASLEVVGHTPLADDDAKTLVGPSAGCAVQQVGHGLLVTGGHFAILAVGVSSIVELFLASILPRRVVMELNAHVVFAVALDIGWNDEATIIKAKF